MPPQNNRQPDVMEGLRALASLGMMAPRQPEPEPNPFGPAGRFAPEESGVWEPGIESLLPTGPIDMAVETILSGIMQDNPKLGIALGLFGPKVAKTVNVSGGRALSRRGFRKGFEKAKTDPMFGDIDFEELSEFVPFHSTKSNMLKQGAVGLYQPKAGLRHMQQQAKADKTPGWMDIFEQARARRVPIEPIGRRYNVHGMPKPMQFSDFTLWHLLSMPGTYRQLPKTAFHEAAHFKQHTRGTSASAPWDYHSLSMGTWPKPKNVPGGPGFKKLPHSMQEIIETNPIRQKKIKYLSNPIETEARLEEIWSFGKKASKSELRELKYLGYSDNQIDKMIKDYGKARAEWYPPK